MSEVQNSSHENELQFLSKSAAGSHGGKIVFGIIGSGWRTEFFLRIAKAMPDRFHVAGIVTRSAEKGRILEQTWGVQPYLTLDGMLEAAALDFVVVSVPWEVAPVMTRELAARNVPVLSETPPAPDLDGLKDLYALVARGAKIQVAEQYHLQPLHAARIAMANSGKLGEVSQVQLSSCHGYHGISLIRRLLGVTFENATIRAMEITTPLVEGRGRDGGPDQEKMIESKQVIATLDFGGKIGIYDFTGDQYFSWIRAQRLLVRGNRGEITEKTVRYLKNFQTPIEFELTRKNAGEDGNLEGLFLKGIQAGEEWIYLNPTLPARLSDDEIAIASCLMKMHEYVHGGPSFYSLAEASQDHYLSLMMEEAVRTGGTVVTESQLWRF